MPKTKSVPFYPNEAYIRRNWAPEQIPEAQIKAIANAAAHAVKAGVLSPDLARSLVATALTERRNDFGVNVQAYPRSKQLDDIITKMGLKVKEVPPVPPEAKDWSDLEYDMWEAQHAGQPGTIGFYRQHDEKMDLPKTDNFPGAYAVSYHHPDENQNNDTYARFAAAVLAHKAKLYGAQKAVERWNGRGRIVEQNRYAQPGGGLGPAKMSVVADAENHASKVARALQMLQHPANAQIRAIYEAALPPTNQMTLGQIGAQPAQQPQTMPLSDIAFPY